MFRHFITTSIRYLVRNKGLTIINILGLAIGICIFILIMHYVKNELSYDKFIGQQETVCRMEFEFKGEQQSWTTSAMGPDCVNNIPEAKSFVRLKSIGEYYWEYNKEKYRFSGMVYADSNIFDLFDFEMIAGDPTSVLSSPYSLVITETMKNRIFGDEDALGKTFLSGGGREFMITGIVKDPPNFHRPFDVLVSFVTLGALYGQERLYTYKTYQYDTYIEIEEKALLDSVNSKLNKFFHEKMIELYGEPEEEEDTWEAYLRPVKEVYFARHVEDGGTKHGNKQFVLIFIIIANFIILIACINFINISTARSASRAMEVGIKKVAGSSRRKLIIQFLSESVLTTLIATLLGLLLVELVFPEFENIVGTDLRIAYLENPVNLLFILMGILVLGVSAGIYPAFYLTSFQPVSVLKGEKSRGKSAGILRKFLIVFQFSVSIILIIGTMVVYLQLQFQKNADLGFNRDNIITIGLSRDIDQNKEAFKEKLVQYPQIESVSYSYTVPGGGDNWEGFGFEGNQVSSVVYMIDPEYIDLMGMEIVDGRNFSRDLITDKQRVCLINETFARDLQSDSLVGKHFDHPEWYITAIPSKEIEIIGVVKDFHYKSFRQEIEALMFVWGDEWVNYANIRVRPDNLQETIKSIEKVWKDFSPRDPFNYRFMNENFERMYRSDLQLGKIFRYFAGLAIFIAILGLFGLAAFIAEQRTREIGIRKAMGASMSKVTFLLVWEFTWLILVASVIAWTIAWFWAKSWLQEFVYRMELNIWIFIIGTLIALAIAWITVISQTLKAANTNPADSLRYE